MTSLGQATHPHDLKHLTLESTEISVSKVACTRISMVHNEDGLIEIS